VREFWALGKKVDQRPGRGPGGWRLAAQTPRD